MATGREPSGRRVVLQPVRALRVGPWRPPVQPTEPDCIGRSPGHTPLRPGFLLVLKGSAQSDAGKLKLEGAVYVAKDGARAAFQVCEMKGHLCAALGAVRNPLILAKWLRRTRIDPNKGGAVGFANCDRVLAMREKFVTEEIEITFSEGVDQASRHSASTSAA